MQCHIATFCLSLGHIQSLPLIFIQDPRRIHFRGRGDEGEQLGISKLNYIILGISKLDTFILGISKLNYFTLGISKLNYFIFQTSETKDDLK
jgi:hypothetical protein